MIGLEDNTQVMMVALYAVAIGLVFSQLASFSPFMIFVGIMFIMGAFIVAVTAFLLFLREWILTFGTA